VENGAEATAPARLNVPYKYRWQMTIAHERRVERVPAPIIADAA
jgi:hypothetical protein